LTGSDRLTTATRNRARPEMAPDLRWVAVHMIEETARHAGHAEIIRETIDRSRGL
jgi:hypothetical protein